MGAVCDTKMTFMGYNEVGGVLGGKYILSTYCLWAISFRSLLILVKYIIFSQPSGVHC
jgi:hypothetical protein